jgi:hypothetical protein
VRRILPVDFLILGGTEDEQRCARQYLQALARLRDLPELAHVDLGRGVVEAVDGRRWDVGALGEDADDLAGRNSWAIAGEMGVADTWERIPICEDPKVWAATVGRDIEHGHWKHIPTE